MYVGLREQLVIAGVGVGLCLLLFLLYPWWLALAAVAAFIPLFLQIRRLGSSGREAARPPE